MNNNRYGKYLEMAEVFDSWRIVPRIIIFVFLAVFVWAVVFVLWTYFHLPPVERTALVTAFVSVVLTALTTALPFIVKIYTDNGRDWDLEKRQPPATQSS